MVAAGARGAAAQVGAEVAVMPVIEHRRVVTAGPRKYTQTAVCDDDACPWKHRGRTVGATHIAAEAHALKTGHTVNVYEECRTTIGAVDAR